MIDEEKQKQKKVKAKDLGPDAMGLAGSEESFGSCLKGRELRAKEALTFISCRRARIEDY